METTMFTANIGTPDRIIRLLAGAALVLWFFLDQGGGALHWAKIVVGVILLGTAFLNYCPIYRILGISSRG
jgi:hypothetical protein